MNDGVALVAMAHPGSIDPGPRPELLWIDVGLLDVDNRYQRTLESRRSQALIDKIAAGFRWSSFQAVLLTRSQTTEGRFLIIDGQHRVEAARRLGIADVPAVVIGVASLAEQANAFVRANTDRVAVNNFALYHARLAAGDPSARAVDKLCRAAGITIPRYPIPADKMVPGQTLALAVIEKLPAKFGENVALLTLKAVGAAYRLEGGAVRAAVLQAVATLLREVDAAARAALAERIQQALGVRTSADLRGKTAQKRFRYGGTEASCVVAQIKEDMRRTAVVPVAAGSIRGPTRAQLMGGR